MSTLKGIFPEPKKEQKKNFIRENVKQLKFIQGKGTQSGTPKPFTKPSRMSPGVEASLSSKSSKLGLTVAKPRISPPKHKNVPEVKIKKGDMAEFLRRKELFKQAKAEEPLEEPGPTDSMTMLRDIGCQTTESNVLSKDDNSKLTMLYPKKDDEPKNKASGDSERHRTTKNVSQTPRRGGDEAADYEKPRGRINSNAERKEHKDPHLPSGYQKGVLPKYLRERKESGVKEAEGVKADNEGASCPPGHVPLPDTERKETLRMLRNSFAELVSELNKMPVKTDTLRMRNRKMELEKQLAKLEEGIKVFSRPKVFVKIGE